MLIIEDDETQAFILKQMLTQLQFSNIEIRQNFTEQSFKAYLQHEQDNLKFVFTDNQLPGIQGINIIEIFKSYGRKRGCNAKIFMVSGEAGANFKQKVLSLGADGFIVKPV